MVAPAFPKVRVGDPVRHESLSVFPLMTNDREQLIEYLLSDEAVKSEQVTVEEVSEGGSVPELMVENKGDTRVLFIEGEELIGAKQNRVLNTSLLIAAHSKVKIPVSCVEQGRWRYRSKWFGHSGSHCSSAMRAVLKGSVSKSAKLGLGHGSDQSGVWAEVARAQKLHHVSSATMAMSDTYESLGGRVDEYRTKLPYVEGASGMAVAVGDRIVAVDLFDKPSTCEKVWSRLLSGFIMDALESNDKDKSATTADVEKLIDAEQAAPWEQTRPVGEGEEFRADDNGSHASALCLKGELVHGSMIAE